MADLDPAELLSGLNDAQREAVTTSATPLCVHAGAGSGKTRVLTRRIAHRAAVGDLDPRHALALTFTRKAAGELRSRLRALGLRDEVAAGTFHATAFAQLRARWAERGQDPPQLLERKLRFVGDLLADRADAQDVVGEIEWASARMVAPDDYPEVATRAGRRPPLPLPEMARVLRRYGERKAEARMVDFDDLLRMAIRIMTDEPEAAAAHRWRYRHLFVDEFQDVNPLQYRLLREWLGDGDDLFVVGDPHQAIYGWNGADARYLDRFREVFRTDRYPDTRVLHLLDNYRSTPQVLAVASTVVDTARLVAHRAEGPLPVVIEHPTGRDEARAVARDIRARHAPGRPWSSQAVLVRTNALAATIGEALAAAQIPHHLRGSESLLRRPAVSSVLQRLRREPYEVVLADVRDAVDNVDDDEDEEAEGRTADLATLVTLSREYETLDAAPSGPAFAAWLAAAVRSGDDDHRNVVEVSTFHAAKGLEWPVVHLAGLEDGLVPISFAKSDETRAEERRLLYVALTRAEDEVRLNWARQRSTAGREPRERRPSPYLEPIEDAIDDLAHGRQPADGRARARLERAKLRAQRPDLDDEGAAVVERLRAWRTQKAKEAGVPAFVILHDKTLQAMAAARPDTRAGLLALPGIGPVKVQRFGDDLLEVLNQPSR
jgi:ATP-dependent DNA helicase UvrD/PcrA